MNKGDRYYLTPENAALCRRIEALAATTPGVHFARPLGTNRYYNMDQVVAQSLALFDKLAADEALEGRGLAEPVTS